MYLAPELYAIFNRSHSDSLAIDFENMTSQYKNCGIINAVTNLCHVFSSVNCDIVHRRFRVNSTFRQTLDTWSSQVNSEFINSPRFLTFREKAMVLPPMCKPSVWSIGRPAGFTIIACGLLDWPIAHYVITIQECGWAPYWYCLCKKHTPMRFAALVKNWY
jgi:hypothetical protein